MNMRTRCIFGGRSFVKRIGEECEGVGGFYTLRHLGATEFGSRDGCSIGAMKRWLGHSASSDMADVYMKPVSPENRPVVEWIRTALRTGKADLRLVRKAEMRRAGEGNRTLMAGLGSPSFTTKLHPQGAPSWLARFA